MRSPMSTIDGKSIGAVNAYMSRQVSGNHTSEVTFVKGNTKSADR